ncbi:MAG: hypothetical protein R3F16_07400 [Myxococcota bacterium]
MIAISRAFDQRTGADARRIPMPMIEDETTCVVETVPPSSPAPSTIAVEAGEDQ